ncbi:MAG TPA: NAD(P)H-dependent oxidoreductase [Chitinophagaceae bacterium]|nr:NAD(P)H-dependent oxidoreductase [Chitinophagaceae bacterium]
MNVLVINGHPRENSFSGAFLQAYVTGAREAGATIETLKLASLCFDPNVTCPIPHRQYAEPDIENARQLILWANHIVFIYPTWWGTMPALLKGFIDRVFISGFAFEETEAGAGYAPLLRGRSAQVITTMDTPVMIYKLFYRAPGHNAMRRSILQFCGFIVTGILSFGPVKNADQEKRESWLRKVNHEGLKLKNGPLSSWKKFRMRLAAWLKAIRLQFYPMTFIAYAAGTFGAQQAGYGFDPAIFWLGYIWLFFLEVSTVLSNDYFDYVSDKQNRFYGPFTGGSRVIVDRLLSFRQISKGIFFSLGLSFAALSILLFTIPGSLMTISMICGILFVMALGYTVPPLKLSYRGLGEITVGLTHSFAVIICGYLFQGGGIADSLPWFISLPLFLAVLPSITLSGIPDFDADKAASKKTLAVRVGKKGAARLAISFTILSAVSIIVFILLDILPGTFNGILYGVIPHAGFLSFLLFRYIKDRNPCVRIDSLMIASLTYLMWFAVIPLINLY